MVRAETTRLQAWIDLQHHGSLPDSYRPKRGWTLCDTSHEFSAADKWHPLSKKSLRCTLRYRSTAPSLPTSASSRRSQLARLIFTHHFELGKTDSGRVITLQQVQLVSNVVAISPSHPCFKGTPSHVLGPVNQKVVMEQPRSTHWTPSSGYVQTSTECHRMEPAAQTMHTSACSLLTSRFLLFTSKRERRLLSIGISPICTKELQEQVG